MNRWLVPLGSGLVFGVGLVVAGMTRPAKVVGFLDVAGAWDPSLALVMVGAIAVYVLAWRRARRMTGPLFADRFVLPARKDLDARLVIGAGVFGIGWGLAGFCPGPGIVSLASGGGAAMVFVAAMAAGMVGQRALDRLHEHGFAGLRRAPR